MNIQQAAAESSPFFAESVSDKAYREGFEAGARWAQKSPSNSKKICQVCGREEWTHRPESNFMGIWRCIEKWRNKK